MTNVIQIAPLAPPDHDETAVPLVRESAWKEDPGRIELAFRGLSEAFGARIRSLMILRVVPDGPLSLLRMGVDKLRRGDLMAADEAVPGFCIVSAGRFHLDIDMLPKPSKGGRSRRRGPFDRGAAPDERKQELIASFRNRRAAGLVLHDNIYGRSIEIIGREEGRWLLRTTFPDGLIDRARIGVEIATYVHEGWWTA